MDSSIQSLDPEITKDGELLLSFPGGRDTFGAYYDSYYPDCRFTALSRVNSLWYAAGTGQDNEPHLFSSISGATWTEQVLEASSGGIPAKEYGSVIAILPGALADELLLVTDRGIAITIPDCVHCIEASRFTEDRMQKAALSGDQLVCESISGKKLRFPIETLTKHRVKWPWVTKHRAELIDLRPEELVRREPLPIGHSIPCEVFLKRLQTYPRKSYLALMDTDANRADSASALARKAGWNNCRSMGSILDVLAPEM